MSEESSSRNAAEVERHLRENGVWESARRRVNRNDAFREIIEGTLADARRSTETPCSCNPVRQPGLPAHAHQPGCPLRSTETPQNAHRTSKTDRGHRLLRSTETQCSETFDGGPAEGEERRARMFTQSPTETLDVGHHAGRTAARMKDPEFREAYVLAELRAIVSREWDKGDHYEHLRATTCDDANLDYHGPSIIYCAALKWVMAEIDRLAGDES